MLPWGDIASLVSAATAVVTLGFMVYDRIGAGRPAAAEELEAALANHQPSGADGVRVAQVEVVTPEAEYNVSVADATTGDAIKVQLRLDAGKIEVELD